MNKQPFIDRQLTREVIVGAFILTFLLGLGIFTIVISKQRFFLPTYKITVRFDDVMGLRTGDEVAVRGMAVGKVRRMELTPTGVLVYAVMDTPVRMKKNYKISIVSSSVLGGSYMQINEGTGEEIVADVYEGTSPHDIISDAADVANALKKSLVEGDVLKNLEGITEQFKQVATRLNEGQSTLGKLLSKDDKLYKDIEDTVSSLKQMVERVDKGEGVLGKLVSKDSKLYDDLSTTASSLREITDSIRKGEGLAGKIFKDDSLYNDLKQTLKEARGAIDEVRESTPLVTFTSIFFGAF